MRLILFALFAGSLAFAQTKNPAEEKALEQALEENAGSPIDYARALERHLQKFPNSPRKSEIERILTQSAMDNKDEARLIRYGLPTIESGSRNAVMMDLVARALLARPGKDSQEKALMVTAIAVEAIQNERQRQLNDKEPGSSKGRRLDDTEIMLARAIAVRSRALRQAGRNAEAAAEARDSFATIPNADGARELSLALEASGDIAGALDAEIDAFTVADPRVTVGEREASRSRMDMLASKAGVDANKLGGRVLASWDRNTQLAAKRRERIIAFDPNTGATKPLDFTLGGLDGKPLALESLKGKVVVLDFWATWCGPCRAQYPLYEQVKAKFKANPDVVFIGVNTDEERHVVAPFLAERKWSKSVYFADGLDAFFRINSIPTTVVIGRTGNVASRMIGFTDRFVDMLTERINLALEEKTSGGA